MARPPVVPNGLLLRLAWLALFWERAWPALWPVTAALLGFVAMALFDLPSMLPGWLHLMLLGGLAAGIALLFWRARREIRLPAPSAASRRIERDSGLSHRPLAALADRPVADEPLAQAVWALHQARARDALRGLRVEWPRAGLLARDPQALRVALALLVVIAAVGAGSDSLARLGRAFVPRFDTISTVALQGVDLWITPPDYTGLPPIYVGTDAHHPQSASDAPVPVPTGSTLLVLVHGGRRTPELAIDQTRTALAPAAAGDYSLTMPLVEGHRLVLSQAGTALIRLSLTLVPDLPPSAEFAKPLGVTAQGALKLDYRASDDYGVTSLRLEARQIGEPAAAPLTVELPAAGGNRKLVQGTSYQDLTADPRAGLPVDLTLVATDAVGQTGTSKPVRITLPERPFHNPVARAIIEQRKLLVAHPDEADAAAETLSDLSVRPDFFGYDFAVFLALRAAIQGLARPLDRIDFAHIEQLLWQAALHIEEGQVPDAQKSLRAAEQALQEALARDAPESEIRRLTDELRQAIQRYLQAMLENADRTNDAADTAPADPTRILSPRDFDRMLDQATQMARSGAKDAARQALAQMQDLLEQLKARRPGSGQGGASGNGTMRQMQELMGQQQRLLDRAYRQNQHGALGQPGGGGKDGKPQPGGEAKDLSGAQEALRRQLDDLRQKLGPGDAGDGALDRVEQSMRDAVGALDRGQGDEAVTRQGEALERLQEAARVLAERLGQQTGEGDPGKSTGADPFGRAPPGAGGNDRGDVQIPQQSQIQRSREILDELRRRAGERARPSEEHDYIDRLLRRF